MPNRLDDGTFVYPTMRHAVTYAQMAGFDIVKDNVGTIFASRDDMPTYFQLVEVPGPYLNYSWERVRVRSY